MSEDPEDKKVADAVAETIKGMKPEDENPPKPPDRNELDQSLSVAASYGEAITCAATNHAPAKH